MAGVRSRLGALRRQAGSPPEAQPEEPGEAGRARAVGALREELRRLGAARRDARSSPARLDDGALAERFGGTVLAEGCIAVRTRIPHGAAHGRHVLGDEEHGEALELFAAGGSARGAIFLDTETTGLAGGTGTVAFVLGMARFSPRGLEITQLLLTTMKGEAAMLAHAPRVVEADDALVTYNGRAFDHPLLAARYRLAAMADPFAVLPHADLLHATRRAFLHRWPDCRLRTAEERLLGFERIGDLGGAEAPQAWFDWLRHGRAENLARVLEHNRWDLVSLAALLGALKRCHEDPVAARANVSACIARRGRLAGEEALYAYLRERRSRLDPRARLELARLARRGGDWTLAVGIWEELAESGSVRALEHLAKYHEHTARDLPRAMACAERLAALEPGESAHRRRRARLQRRLRGRPRAARRIDVD